MDLVSVFECVLGSFFYCKLKIANWTTKIETYMISWVPIGLLGTEWQAQVLTTRAPNLPKGRERGLMIRLIIFYRGPPRLSFFAEEAFGIGFGFGFLGVGDRGFFGGFG